MKMPKAEPSTPVQGLSSEALLLALLTLQVEQRERNAAANPDQIKTEILLAGVGLTYQQIAAMMNKSPDAVRMMLARTRKTDAKKQPAAKSKGAE